MKALQIFLSVVLVLNLGCIHTTSYESKPVISQKDRSSYTAIFKSPKVQVKNLIYSHAKYPLEDFFSQLARGRFKTAFEKARLSYKPANSQNEILTALLNSGLVPVLVEVKNTSTRPVTISYDEFYLAGSGARYRSLDPERLPSHIRQFSPEAVAANVFNVAVVATVALMMVLLLAHANGNASISDFTDEKILNPTERVTHVSYERFVIRKSTLAPGQEVAGLVFFSIESMSDTEGFALEHLPAF